MDEIRECIGCNICVSGDFTMSPIRCTQNPSMGEEWRRGWHPERIRPRHAVERVLVVGAGPAGLEAAMSAGRRGYEVVLVEATRDLGGRVATEARLPGLGAWIRVVDYRVGQIDRLSNVEIFRESKMTADEILTYGFQHVAIATGSHWRADGAGRWHTRGIPLSSELPIFTPDDILRGKKPNSGRVVLFDDDHYYMGGVIAELLVKAGCDVTFVTPSPTVSSWTENTLELDRVQQRIRTLGINLRLSETLLRTEGRCAIVACRHTGREFSVETDALVLVTARLPHESLALELIERKKEWSDAGLLTATAIGDALAPSTIAAAVWDGRRFAEDLGVTRNIDDTPFKREVVLIEHELAKLQEPRRVK